MMNSANKDASRSGTPTQPMDAARMASYRKSVERLPITMRPAINQQLAHWDSLFPFEQNQLGTFLHGLESIPPSTLDALTQPLTVLENKMGVAQWNFSQTGDTMENASLLARSEFYGEWRREVQRIFEAINAAAKDVVAPQASPSRLVLIVLPRTLPVAPLNEWKSWDPRGRRIKIDGDSRRISELILAEKPGQPGSPALMAAASTENNSDVWLIDAEAKLDGFLSSAARQASCSLSYSALMPFRDSFLAQVNTVPKSIEATDQTLAAMRHGDWEAFWPTELAGQTRLRNFVIDLFLSGNGALIFSNAFVEWAASEALRRARPRVVVARFGLRSKPKPFTGIAIFENQNRISALPDEDDPKGSAVDALILGRYIWLAALRYPEHEETACLCVSEYLDEAYLIEPETAKTPLGARGTARPEEVAEWIAARLAS